LPAARRPGRSRAAWVVRQASIATPSTSTMQAPHSPSPHPGFVPVRPRSARRNARRLRPGGPLSSQNFPFTTALVVAATGRAAVSAVRFMRRSPRRVSPGLTAPTGGFLAFPYGYEPRPLPGRAECPHSGLRGSGLRPTRCLTLDRNRLAGELLGNVARPRRGLARRCSLVRGEREVRRGGVKGQHARRRARQHPGRPGHQAGQRKPARAAGRRRG
jgi:hypothetical protein